MAELTNPLQLPWMWARDNSKRTDISESSREQHRRVYQSLSTPLTFAYVLMRAVLMPISLVDVAVFLFVEGQMTPFLVWIWIICGAGFVGSMFWVHMLVTGWLRFQRKKKKKQG